MPIDAVFSGVSNMLACEADGRSPTAIVAADDTALRDLIVAALSADGFLVSVARDGR